jgi:protein translocase SecG subunit
MTLKIAQIIVSAVLLVLILLQERSSGLSGAFGGSGSEGGFYQTRRGLEKFIFVGTIVLTIVFIGLVIADLLL